ncbi:MAG: glycoside hydrolase family 3 C-terminal domain-containing protein [Anaerolineae bacterium]|nr:glycoside hydrolase family 3 C-terminal domain-containing protein [Anaerolineae bacterium]
MDTDIQSILAKMTIEEKAALCIGASEWSTTPVERLGVPEMIVADGPHGIRRVPDVHSMAHDSLPATCFPTASCSASTWDVELMGQLGAALAEEAIALHVDVVLGPGVNMKRSPLCGRNFEYFSEDPYLAGELAVSYITGVQAKGVGTSLKHFAANNQEFQRFSISSEMDKRTLREIYLPAFEKAVKEAQPWMVMCSYNKLGGVYASEHYPLLTRILKEEWGFEGLVVSDWGAVRDRVPTLRAGLDWEMPGPQDRRVQVVAESVRSGKLAESTLDDAVRRILRVVSKAQETPKGAACDMDAHHRLAHKIAAEGMVLLKNAALPLQGGRGEQAPLLPLKGQRRIAVIGRSAQVPYFQGGGSSHVNPARLDVPFQELQSRAGDAELTYAEGYPADDSFRQDLIDTAVGLARSADVALLFIALPAHKESEGYDRTDLDLTAQQVALIEAVAKAQPKTAVVLNNGAPVAMSAWIDAVPAVLEGWMMGQAGGGALADILFGRANPCGKLAETFPRKLSDTPAYLNWPGGAGKVRYGEGLFIGYRYYDAKELPVLFPFGHGLSYTSFAYTNPQVSARTFRDVDGLTVTLDVTNTGQMAGKEIIQVYVHDCVSGLVRPEKELKGFAKVALQPGETKSVAIKLDFRAFAYYHPEYEQWITEDGDFDILIASSAADIRHTLTVTLQSTLTLPCLLDRDSTLREWLADPRGKDAFGPFYAQVEEQGRKMFGGGEGDKDRLGVDFMDMLGDMPLVSVLMWQKIALPMHPEDLVSTLLDQVHDLAD